jgi:phosphatidylserine decarboxylase
MRLDKNTYGTVLLVYVLSVVLAILLFRFVQTAWLVWPLAALLLCFCLWQTYFHMVPDRTGAGSSSLVSSVADGKVVRIGKAFETCYLCRECQVVSVYMDFWDMHANFWPVTGSVSYTMYHPGEHFLAFKPKASDDNEHACTAIRTDGGKEMMFKQLAGFFARRIVCYSEPGMHTKAGEQCGIIKFGSRIDMFFPTDADIKVKVGDNVRACETVIALL